eukprot:1153109-Pelagomonas_calceolata.AAC.7
MLRQVLRLKAHQCNSTRNILCLFAGSPCKDFTVPCNFRRIENASISFAVPGPRSNAGILVKLAELQEHSPCP